MSMRVTDELDVELVSTDGTDYFLCEIASFLTPVADKLHQIIRELMEKHNGSIFEHALMTFKIHAPIFVWREFMNHKIEIVYNEQSDRYVEFEPVFYMPPMRRGIIQVGTEDDAVLLPGDSIAYRSMFNTLVGAYEISWKAYKLMLEENVAKEIARICLPSSIYSTFYVMMNLRGIMQFLAFETNTSELDEVSAKIEHHFREHFPVTHDIFVERKRISP